MRTFKNKIKKELYDHIIPFWTKQKDHVNGGFIGYTDSQGNQDIYANKGSMLQIRATWFFSRLYNFDHNPAYKEIAKHQFDYLLNHAVDDKGIVWETNYQGIVTDDTKHLYYQAFGLYAAVEYYLSFKDEQAAILSHKLFNYIEDEFKDEYGYKEQLDGKKNRLVEGAIKAERTMNALLHLMEAYASYVQVFKTDKGIEALKRLLDLFEDKIYNKEKKRLDVLFTNDMISVSDYHSYGHDIEASWLLDLAANALEDTDYINRMAIITSQLCRSVYEKGLSKRGIKTEMVNGIEDDSYTWWVQAEGVVAFYKKGMKTHNRRYKRVAGHLLDFIRKNHRNPNTFEVYWKVFENLTPDLLLPASSNWKCPYHNGRMCLEVLEAKENE